MATGGKSHIIMHCDCDWTYRGNSRDYYGELLLYFNLMTVTLMQAPGGDSNI